ncbi:MAG TPA: right-handed parallel beta-helix repeat-containing protein, partial [Arachidicoccus soli]|nr:right-handed parallel beta-helix repeat-containing protein [Arachidicoccus soli]
WKTLANVNKTIFKPGDKILFHAGQSWIGSIKPQGSGSLGKPITIGKYGTGKNPALHGDGKTEDAMCKTFSAFSTISLFNQQYWTIRDLEVTNFDSTEEGGKKLDQWEKDNLNNYANVVSPAPYIGTNSRKFAILIQGNNVGELNNIHLIKLEVHGVNGDITQRHTGGIYFHVFNTGNDLPTYFNDLLVDSCYVHDVDRIGITNASDYDNRTLTTNIDWTPNKKFIIRNSTIRRTGGNGVIVRVSKDAIVEHCLFDYCGIRTTGNALYPYNADGTILQYNECRFTKANPGDEDAGGIDSDYKSKNTVIQYNYCHDNDYGMLVTGGPGSFNDSTIIRYNIFERDGLIGRKGHGKFAIRFAGSSTNTIFYNNIFYLGPKQTDTKMIYYKEWRGTYADKTFFYNNIFYNQATGTSYDYSKSIDNFFSSNAFYGNPAFNEPNGPNKIIGDPRLVNPGGSPAGYKLKSGSSMMGKGIKIQGAPTKDYYGNLIKQGAINVGIDQER